MIQSETTTSTVRRQVLVNAPISDANLFGLDLPDEEAAAPARRSARAGKRDISGHGPPPKAIDWRKHAKSPPKN